MKIGTEQEWQAARKGLLGAERELEEHARRVELATRVGRVLAELAVRGRTQTCRVGR